MLPDMSLIEFDDGPKKNVSVMTSRVRYTKVKREGLMR